MTIGRLGGWLGRTRDPPGAQLMWHGYTQLVAMAFAFELRTNTDDPIRITSSAGRSGARAALGSAAAQDGATCAGNRPAAGNSRSDQSSWNRLCRMPKIVSSSPASTISW